ncbi:tetratricopeptide repeat protein [Actinophytocola glycyrrhizae]|uniref:Tetratricopeptide repeat protein n=1 Tax=Actinophytocola glycyrrhizae TaxID=2044873 RepID=A0ABV9S840_9PSEU
MRVVHVLFTPGLLATAATVVPVVVLTRPDVVTGLLGALTGGLAAVVASQAGLLASVLVPGVTLRRLVIGAGPRVADWPSPHRIVTLRAVPVILSVSVRAVTAARIRVVALCGLAFEVALAACAVAVAGGPFTAGFAAGAVAALVVSLVPKRTATTTSTGWLLFRLPSSGGGQAAPLVAMAMRAARTGDLTTAESLAAQLRVRHPGLPSALAARIRVLAAQGRYAEAVVLAVRLTSGEEHDPGAFVLLAGLTCATVESGQLDSETGLTTASRAIDNAAALGYPGHRLNGARAMVALLRGDPKDAITLARLAASTDDDVLCRADDLATLARAHMAAGDNRAARQVLTEAEKLAGWWPRVATTRTRLEVAS